jgi:hypothetical protein
MEPLGRPKSAGVSTRPRSTQPLLLAGVAVGWAAAGADAVDDAGDVDPAPPQSIRPKAIQTTTVRCFPIHSPSFLP